MSDPVQPPEQRAARPKRRYDSTRRTEQARETRRCILDAARELFSTRGYTGATMEAVAGKANVAVETVYAAFGSKRALLSALVGVLVAGDDEPLPLLERSTPQAIRSEPDQRRQIAAFADDITQVLGRIAPIYGVIRAAATTEPEIAELLRQIQRTRFANLSRLVSWVAANGPLHERLDVASAAETVWTVASPDTFCLLAGDRGWSPERYARWLEDSLIALLLPPQSARRGGSAGS